MLIIAGPTGVGKTEFSLKLAALLKNPVIINADLGQLYKPLTIGTAKPDWRNEPVPHYLFDLLEKPENFTAFNYRRTVSELLEKLKFSGAKISPIVVGGSGFYLQALFFKSPLDNICLEVSDNSLPTYDNNSPDFENLNLWEKLNLIDPKRAQELNSHDFYRIQRALEIWQNYKILPSQAKPVFAPIIPSTQKVKLIILTRDLPELYSRIDQRVLEMLAAGWLTEVQDLVNTPWEEFLLTKRLIGYDNLINFFHADSLMRVSQFSNLIPLVQRRSRNYAKRQIAFFKMLDRQLTQNSAGQVEIEWLNLTATNVDLYIKRLLSDPDFADIKSE